MEKGVDVMLFAIVQETLGEVEGELFTVVTGNGYLSLQLAFGCL
jgi:hypothetical protein